MMLLVASCLSCSGPRLNPASGKVLLKGEPIKGALVAFHPKGSADANAQAVTGSTGEDGTFTVTTGKEDGIAAGEYTVTIVWIKEKEGKRSGTEPPELIDALEGRYSDAAKSQFNVQIKSGRNTLEPFKLE